jgi:hypothetical protein
MEWPKQTGGDNQMSKKKLELRSFQHELRDAAENEPTKLVGYAAVFNSPADIAGVFTEVIQPGAFTETIKTDPILALLNHNNNLVLGRNTSGTLLLREDAKGLYFEIDIPDTTVGRDLTVLIQRGDIDSCSFAFSPDEESWDHEQNIRTLQKVTLYDISVVTNPAYSDTSVSARSADDVLTESLASVVPSAITPDVEVNDIAVTPLDQYLEVLKSW